MGSQSGADYPCSFNRPQPPTGHSARPDEGPPSGSVARPGEGLGHDISLESGGGNDITNLWPEPNDKTRGNTKDDLENKLHELVCSGQMNLEQAQGAIRGDRTVAYRKYVGPLGGYRSYSHGGD